MDLTWKNIKNASILCDWYKLLVCIVSGEEVTYITVEGGLQQFFGQKLLPFRGFMRG